MSRYLYLDNAGVIREGNFVQPSPINYSQETRALSEDEGIGKYFVLGFIPDGSSLLVQVSGVSQFEGIDYTVVNVGSEVRVQFIGQLAAGGISEVVEGDIVSVRYALPPIDNSFEFQKQTISLGISEVQNKYFLLPSDSIPYSETIIAGGTTLIRGVDYTFEDMGSEKRVVLSGTLAAPGMDAVSVGETFQTATAKAIQ